MKNEYIRLFYNLVWSAGLLNAEKNRYAEIFCNQGGVDIVLSMVNSYGIIDNDFDTELESVCTYCLTNVCYGGSQRYEIIKPIMRYLQFILVKTT